MLGIRGVGFWGERERERDRASKQRVALSRASVCDDYLAIRKRERETREHVPSVARRLCLMRFRRSSTLDLEAEVVVSHTVSHVP
jgi:hypothetical protein